MRNTKEQTLDDALEFSANSSHCFQSDLPTSPSRSLSSSIVVAVKIFTLPSHPGMALSTALTSEPPSPTYFSSFTPPLSRPRAAPVISDRLEGSRVAIRETAGGGMSRRSLKAGERTSAQRPLRSKLTDTGQRYMASRYTRLPSCKGGRRLSGIGKLLRACGYNYLSHSFPLAKSHDWKP